MDWITAIVEEVDEVLELLFAELEVDDLVVGLGQDLVELEVLLDERVDVF